MKPKNLTLISFFAGTSIVLFGCILFTLFVPLDSGIEVNWDHTKNDFPAYRFMLMLILSIFLSSIAIHVWKHYKVNYIFILDMDVNYKINQFDLLRFVSIFLSLWLFCFLGDLVIVKHE